MTLLPQGRTSGGILLSGLALAAVGVLVSTPQAQQPPPDNYRYKVDVQLVLVPASISTRDGKPVTGLEEGAFEIYEDGQLRPLKVFEKKTGLPLRLALLVDTSLSTAGELRAEKAALARFIQRVLRPADTAALYEFSGGVHLLADFSDSAKTLEATLATIRPRAGTALYDAIGEASDKLKEHAGRRVLVLVTDGNDTTSKLDFHAALRAAQEAEASIFALIVRPIPGESGRSLRGEHALMSLADLTGGRVFFPAGVKNLDPFFDELSELLRTQYLLGYAPAPARARPEFRAIEVRIKGQDYRIEHRKGYYTEARR